MAVAEVWYTRTDSPIGALTLVATPAGLAAISFGSARTCWTTSHAPRGRRGRAARGRLDDVRRELDEYFAGERQVFEVPLDRCLSTGFMRSAQEAISRIPYGAVASYGDIAAGAGQPGATRAAGTACRTNPIPVVVPCHRVLRSDGSIGGYAGDMAGGLDIKRHLLALEGVQLTLFVS